ncbi:MAG: SH3 domain-containing protein [Candidatus Aminicenantales bacterium]
MMTKKPLILLLACLLAAPLLAAPQEKAAAFKIKVTADQANIRDIPDIGSAILQQVPAGTILDAEKKEGEWYMVRFVRDEGTAAVGYIHESLVQRLEAATGPAKEKPKTETVKREEPVRLKTEEKAEPVKIEPVKTEPARTAETTPAQTAVPGRIEEPEGVKTFTLSFLAGMNSAAVGDLNTGAQGLADYFGDVLATEATGTMDGLHLTYVLGAELAYSVMPGLDLTFGADYYAGRRTSRMEYSAGGTPDALVIRPKIEAMPFKVGVMYHPLPYLYVKGNLQLIFAKCNYLYRYENGSYWQEWQGDTKSIGLGAGVAAGGEWEFYPGLFLLGEAGFTLARFGGFEGKEIIMNSEGETYTEQGALYYYLSEVSGGGAYPLVFIRGALPSEASASLPREARLNLNGFSLKVGIGVRF